MERLVSRSAGLITRGLALVRRQGQALSKDAGKSGIVLCNSLHHFLGGPVRINCLSSRTMRS
jgi:hypothetical protein